MARLNGLLGANVSFLRLDARPDEELLSRFLDERDETAFAALITRHTPAVRAACRGWLRSAADIDDAAQATFLVLVQRGGSIRDRRALGRWLYGVAGLVARRLRQRWTTACSLTEDVPSRASLPPDDLQELLAEEIARLPEKYRLPVQLCYWGGLTTAETALRLGWPKGTVLTRLAWARKHLQKSLSRRGVAPALFLGLAASTSAAVSASWVRVTARAATRIWAGESPGQWGFSERTVSLSEGVVRMMVLNRLKYIALALLMAVGLLGYGIGQWVTASDGAGKDGKLNGQHGLARDKEAFAPESLAAGQELINADETRAAPAGRRREVVIRMPAGTYVKEVDAGNYGSGRITWNYEDERVSGIIEARVMGGECDLFTEAEISLSSTGTIYGLLTSLRINHLKLPQGEEFDKLQPFLGLWPAVEPLVNEVTTDLPFSYQFRVQNDRLTISNFRMMLAGPNPLGKLGGMAMGQEVFMALGSFQALGTAVEGTYLAPDAKEKPVPAKRPIFQKPKGKADVKSTPKRGF